MTIVGETKTTSGFEKLLFWFTRVFALVGSFVAFAGIVVLLLSLFNPSGKKTLISLSDLRPVSQAKKRR